MSYQKGALTKEILLIIAGVAALSAIMIVPNLAKALGPIIKTLSQRAHASPLSVKKALFRLKAQRLIDYREKDGKVILKITQEGKRKILAYQLDGLKIMRPKKWDRRWRMIIFDIPEKKRGARVAFRLKLEELGFYPLQKSCYIFPFECKDEIDFVSEMFQVAPYVNYIVAHTVEGEKILKKHFEL